MPISKEQKIELVESYKEKINNSHAIVIARYSGLDVQNMESLRNRLRESEASFLVAKKTLMSRAFGESDLPIPEEVMEGPIGFAFLGEDIAAGARALKDIAKESEDVFGVQGGLLGQSVLDADSARALADLPSREVQLAQLIAAIAAPATSLVSLISAPHRDIVSLLQARIDKEGGDDAEQAEAA